MEKIDLREPECKRFVSYALSQGGDIENTGYSGFSSHFPAYCNPSIFWDEETGRFLMNQRTVSYFIHSSKDNFDSWGPLHYIIQAERYNWLETVNHMGVSSNPLEGFNFKEIKMKERKHQWEFHGLEDIRVVRWNGILYGIGVRRDDNPTGRGRMELCELDEDFNEVKSVKMKAVDENTYCVKNWMPITDMPYHFIDTANPLRIVKADPVTGDVEVVVEKPKQPIFQGFDMPRGSSHCIPFRDGHLCMVHTCQMYYTGNKRKYARYLHAFVYFNRDWDIEKVSPLFSFNDFLVEFCCGMAMKDDDMYISFAVEDNMSYVLKMPKEAIERFIWEPFGKEADGCSIWHEKCPQKTIFDYAMELYRKKDYAGAYTWFQRDVDLFDDYNARYMQARLVADMGHRDTSEIGLWILCIESDPQRPEGYMGAAAYYKWRGHYPEGGYFAKRAMEKYATYPKPLFYYNEQSFMELYRNIMFETQYYDMVDKVAKAKKAF